MFDCVRLGFWRRDRFATDELVDAALRLGDELLGGSPDLHTPEFDQLTDELLNFSGKFGSWQHRNEWRDSGTFGGLRPSSLRSFDRRVRRRSTAALPSWSTVSPTAARDGVVGSPLPVAAAALFSHHPNGRVRQVAVELLVAEVSGDELPYLLLRAADWIEEVRRPACAAVRERIGAQLGARSSVQSTAESYRPLFIYWLSLIDCDSLRNSSPELYEELDEWLVGSDGVSDLFNGLRLVHDEKFNGLIADRLIRNPGTPGVELFRSAGRMWGRVGRAMALAGLERLRGADLETVLTVVDRHAVRPWALAAVLDEQRADQAIGLQRLRRLRSQPWSALRTEARRLLEFMSTEEIQERLIDCLFATGSVRDMAQPQVRALGLDPAEYYRRELGASGLRVTAALEGIGETGHRSDAALLAPYLHHPSEEVRCAAVNASRLDLDAYVEHLRQARVEDPSRLVRVAAARRLGLAWPDNL